MARQAKDEAAAARILELRGQIESGQNWVRAMLDLHQPYVSGRIDVSGATVTKMAEDFHEKLKRNIFCAECSTPWPCRQIGRLVQLRDALRIPNVASFDYESKREQHIEVAL